MPPASETDPAPAPAPLLCLCGCGVELPEGRSYFASSPCIETWATRYGSKGTPGRKPRPDPEPEASVVELHPGGVGPSAP